MLIYKIVCNITNEMYVGSTTNFLARQNAHKVNSNKCVSKQIIDRDDYYFEIVEELDENSTTHQLLLRENYWIIELNSINKVLPLLTDEQRLIHNKKTYEKNKIKSKEYYYNNKEKQLLNVLNYRTLNIDLIKEKVGKTQLCSCGKTYTYGNRLRHFKSNYHNKRISV
jgi:hypothetical protein